MLNNVIYNKYSVITTLGGEIILVENLLNNLWLFTISTISQVGGIVFIGKSIFDYFSKRSERSWQKEHNIDIEILKGEIGKNQALLSTAMSCFSSERLEAQSRKITAIEEAWKDMLKIRTNGSSASFIYNIFLPTEYNLPPSYAHIKESNIEKALEEIMKFETDIHRPFLGEKLWIIFWLYRMLLARILHLVSSGKKSQCITDWRLDNLIMNNLATILSKEEMQMIKEATLQSVDLTCNLLEFKFLDESNALISGDKAAEMNIDKAMKLAKLMAVRA